MNLGKIVWLLLALTAIGLLLLNPDDPMGEANSLGAVLLLVGLGGIVVLIFAALLLGVSQAADEDSRRMRAGKPPKYGPPPPPPKGCETTLVMFLLFLLSVGIIGFRIIVK